MKLLVNKLHSDSVLPSYGTLDAAGLDLCAYGEHIVPAKSRKVIPTGITIEWCSSTIINKIFNPIDYTRMFLFFALNFIIIESYCTFLKLKIPNDIVINYYVRFALWFFALMVKKISDDLNIQKISKNKDDNPIDYYLRIAPRSGLSVKNNIDIGAGVIDQDYRGEILVCFINNSDVDYNIAHGDRIAQGILERISRFDEIKQVYSVSMTKTDRNNRGFGSTGK